jgi:hypothetical protein
MIVKLTDRTRIAGFAVDCWQLQRHAPDEQTRTIATARSFTEAVKAALAEGMIRPGQPLDLSAFDTICADAARRFVQAKARCIRMSEGYTAEQAGGGRWLLTRDTGRGGKHAVQAGEAASAAAVLKLACWHQSFRAKSAMTIDQVGPYLLGIAQRLLDGATAQPAEHAGSANR